jgi:hypothetical protein
MADLESAYDTLDPSVDHGMSVFDAFGRSLLSQGMQMAAGDNGGMGGTGRESENYVDDMWSTSAWSTAGEPEPGDTTIAYGMEEDRQQSVSTPLSSLPSSQQLNKGIGSSNKDTKAAQKAEKNRQPGAKQDLRRIEKQREMEEKEAKRSMKASKNARGRAQEHPAATLARPVVGIAAAPKLTTGTCYTGSPLDLHMQQQQRQARSMASAGMEPPLGEASAGAEGDDDHDDDVATNSKPAAVKKGTARAQPVDSPVRASLSKFFVMIMVILIALGINSVIEYMLSYFTMLPSWSYGKELALRFLYTGITVGLLIIMVKFMWS